MSLSSVTVRMSGGLGNQMFQYACGRALTHILGGELWLDTRDFDTYFRTFCLDYYNLQIRRCPDNLARQRSGRPENFWRKRWRKLWGKPFLLPQGYYREKEAFHFDPEISSVDGDIYLDGYWQHEGYFSAIRELLLSEFTPRNPASSLAQDYSDRISASEDSVAIHVRLGDYCSNPAAQNFHGLCGKGYYQQAMTEMASLLPSAKFFLFSDEPEAAAGFLPPDFVITAVTVPGEHSMHEELMLMRQCRHQIIANSSYSWWGAWLNNNPNKVVFAPAQWLADPQTQTDIIPAGWRKIRSHQSDSA